MTIPQRHLIPPCLPVTIAVRPMCPCLVPARVGQGPLRFAFGPLTEAATWGFQREAEAGQRFKTPTPEREAGAVNSGNEETGAEAGAVRAHTEADRRKAVFPVSCDVKW